MGPVTVPRNRPAQKRVVAAPRPTADQISAMTPIKKLLVCRKFCIADRIAYLRNLLKEQQKRNQIKIELPGVFVC